MRILPFWFSSKSPESFSNNLHHWSLKKMLKNLYALQTVSFPSLRANLRTWLILINCSQHACVLFHKCEKNYVNIRMFTVEHGGSYFVISPLKIFNLLKLLNSPRMFMLHPRLYLFLIWSYTQKLLTNQWMRRNAIYCRQIF